MKHTSVYLLFTLAILLTAASFATIPRLAFSAGTTGGNLDIFTQKALFNGTGPNKPSDAFQQQELVILYGLVTFRGDPIANEVVGFQISGPPNNIQNYTVFSAATTNASGLAQYSFRIPITPINEDQVIFGTWHVVGTVNVDQVIENDSLTFQVGWLVQITNISTLNAELEPQTSFYPQSPIVFNLTLENIGFTPHVGTITVDALDIDKQSIIQIELDNQTFPPGESYIQTSSYIPGNANIGQANASATPFTAPPALDGIPYSPSAYTLFDIISNYGHDVAITAVNTSTTQATVGEKVNITVVAANLGNFNETFDVTVYYDSNLIQLIPQMSLPPESSKTITVEWNTSNVKPGNYTISANATIVEGDINPENNKFIDGNVTITTVPTHMQFSTYFLLLIPFMIIAILAGIILMFFAWIDHHQRRRKRKPQKNSRYVIIVHPHI